MRYPDWTLLSWCGEMWPRSKLVQAQAREPTLTPLTQPHEFDSWRELRQCIIEIVYQHIRWRVVWTCLTRWRMLLNRNREFRSCEIDFVTGYLNTHLLEPGHFPME